jgi:putative intracellular protease/amidase
MEPNKILIVTSSLGEIENTHFSTGIWLEELATTYYVFKDAGSDMTIASPKGGPAPLDPKSQSILVVTRNGKRFLQDPEAMNFLAQSVMLEEINALDFDMVFLPGGHGALWDLAGNKLLIELLQAFYNSNKPIGSVRHGIAGLLSLIDAEGELLLKGKQLTAFSNAEEESTGFTKSLPFLLETKLLSLGALYSKGASYTNYVVVDGNIVTGQNPASAEGVARKMLSLAQDKKYSTQLATAS